MDENPTVNNQFHFLYAIRFCANNWTVFVPKICQMPPPSPAQLTNGIVRPTVVINHAYDYDNNNQYLNNFRKDQQLLPKCRVEIVENGLNDLTKNESHRKCIVKIKNIEEQKETEPPEMEPSLLMMVENRGYDILAPIKPPNVATTTTTTTMTTIDEVDSTRTCIEKRTRRNKNTLESRDLLNFAKQIATGMVNIRNSNNIVKVVNEYSYVYVDLLPH